MMMTSSSPVSAVSSSEQLIRLFEASMSAQQEVRVSAEKDLTHFSTQPGFLPTLLHLICLPGQPEQLQKAAAVFLKNEVEKRWFKEDQEGDDNVFAKDREAIRDSIVPALVNVCSNAPKITPFLKVVVHRLVRSDFPKNWGNLLEQIAPLLSQNSSASLNAGLILLHEVISWKGFDDDQLVQSIYTSFVPKLLLIAQAGLALATTSEEAALLLKSVLKTIYSCIAYKWNSAVLGESTAVVWCTLITQVIQLEVPQSISCIKDDEERAEKPLMKAKKWAFHCQQRIFARHGCPDGSSFQVPKGQVDGGFNFSKFYMSHMSLAILQVNMELINKVVGSKDAVIISDRIFCLICDYLTEVIRSKNLLDKVLPHLPSVLSSFAFPRLCFSDADKELWEDDALEYCRSMLDPFNDYYSPQSHAANLFIDLCKSRKKHVFPIVLQMITQVMNDPVSDEQSMRRKDGCLFLVGSLARVLLKANMGPQVEGLLTHHLLPLLASTVVPPYLKVRACWMVQQFADMQFENQETVLSILKSLLAGLQDTANLPVQVQSACTLGDLVDQASVQAVLPTVLAPVVEAVLALNSRCEVDRLAFVLEKLVSMFSEELSSFATQLCSSVRDTAIRIIKSTIEAGGVDQATGAVEFEDSDRMMALVGMMRTIATLVDSMADSSQLLASLEEIVVPLLQFILEHKVSDVYEEVFELLESFTYLQKSASPAVWKIVEFLVHKLFKDTDMDYVEEIGSLIDNCVTYDPSFFGNNHALQQGVLEVAQKVLDVGGEYDGYGQEAESICTMMGAILLTCGRSVDALTPNFLSLAVRKVTEEHCDTDSSAIIHLEVGLACLCANPSITLSVLEQAQWTEAFLAKLALLSSKFKRVYDKRLVIAAISNLFNQIPVNQMPVILQNHLSMLLSVYAEAIETLPAAMAERKRLQDEAENESDDDDDFDYDDYNSDDYVDLDSIDEANNNNNNSSQGSKPSSSIGHADDDDEDGEEEEDDWEEDELEENIYFESVLDKMDMASTVQSTVRQFAQSQPSSFSNALQGLSEAHRTLVCSIIQ